MKAFSKKSIVVLRFDASPTIGGGHAVRCLALASELERRGKCCVLACNIETFRSFVVNPPFRSIALHGRLDDELRQLKQELSGGCDVLFIDHFERSYEYETASRGWAKRIAVIDGQRRSHDCDLLIDPNPGRNLDDYLGLVPPKCNVLSGTEFAILRREYQTLRPKSLEIRAATKQLNRILISFGAFSRPNLEERVAHGLEKAGFAGNLIFVGGSAANRTRKAEWNVTFKVEVIGWAESVAVLQSTCDLMIGGGGASVWEGCCLGLPMLLIQVAKNQSYVLSQLEAKGAAIVLGQDGDVTSEKLEAVFRKLMIDPSWLARLSENAHSLCDGLGAKRIVRAVDYLLA
jgi:UDP-2,4-diacetamido-2,4,6-trideoxy-beta-L-altropyranose hydrolase